MALLNEVVIVKLMLGIEFLEVVVYNLESRVP
jgi:hypothetical protein